jgi:hypothetical protein
MIGMILRHFDVKLKFILGDTAQYEFRVHLYEIALLRLYIWKILFESYMSLLNRKSALILGLLTTLVAFGASATPVFAWATCGVTLTPSTQSTTVGPSSTTTFTYLLTYSDAAYPASFTLSATSTNGAWTIVSVSPTLYPSSGMSGSISTTISVKVTAPSTIGSTTTITLTATNNQDHAASCNAQTRLTTVVTHGVPEFPVGMALLMALAVPALLLVRSKSKIIAA